jgi:hypothetical protein
MLNGVADRRGHRVMHLLSRVLPLATDVASYCPLLITLLLAIRLQSWLMETQVL